MPISGKTIQARRDRSIRDGAGSRRGGQERRRSNKELLARAKSGKLTTYGAALLARRKSMGGKGG